MAVEYVFNGETIPLEQESDSDIWSHFVAGFATEDVPLRRSSDYVTFSGETNIYSDVNHITTCQAVPKAVDVAAVYQSLDNIFMTMKTERVFLPEFGANLEDLLFEPMDFTTAVALLSYIVSAVSRWEPRVFIRTDLSSVTPDYEAQKYEVVLYFEIVGLKDEVFSLSRFLTAR